MDSEQSTCQLMMIRPARFAGNTQTAASNRFQDLSDAFAADDAQLQAWAEFDALVARLSEAGVTVHVFDDTPEPHKPDALFPNNWVSFHADGTVVLYPMLAPNRRNERRMDLLQNLSAQGFRIRHTVDLSSHELAQQYLEGTGSLVLDRVNRLAYACLSPRTDMDVLGDFAQRLDYELVTFDAFDVDGVPIYHTNVLMCVGTRFAAVCIAAIADDERAGVLHALQSTGHKVVDLTLEQMAQFAGNMLEVRNTHGQLFIALSQRAFDALTADQRQRLQQHGGPLLAVAIPTIERLGGGSVRCMLAEVFLPLK